MSHINENDKQTIIEVLEKNSFTQESITFIINKIHNESEIHDYWDSPYTRPTFFKILTLSFSILLFFILVINPLFKVLFSNESIEIKKEEIISERWIPSSKDFAFDVELKDNWDWKKEILLYRPNTTLLLWRTDIENNKWYIVSTMIWNLELYSKEKTIITNSNSNLRDDIKAWIIDIINNNISVDDKYLEFKSIDFWVDKIIND